MKRTSFCGYTGGLIVLIGILAISMDARGQDKARKSVWDGVYTDAQAARGQKAYAKSCGGCHRDDLSGGDDEPALRGTNFTVKWQDASLAEMYDYIASNMPKSNPGSLPLDTCVDILTFMLKSNEIPAGQTELTTDVQKLDQIVFSAKKPAQ